MELYRNTAKYAVQIIKYDVDFKQYITHRTNIVKRQQNKDIASIHPNCIKKIQAKNIYETM